MFFRLFFKGWYVVALVVVMGCGGKSNPVAQLPPPPRFEVNKLYVDVPTVTEEWDFPSFGNYKWSLSVRLSLKNDNAMPVNDIVATVQAWDWEGRSIYLDEVGWGSLGANQSGIKSYFVRGSEFYRWTDEEGSQRTPDIKDITVIIKAAQGDGRTFTWQYARLDE